MRLEPIKGYIITVFALMPLAATAQSTLPAAKGFVYAAAQPIEKRAPSYPKGAASSGHEGWVVVSYIVSTSGHVKDVMIEDSTGDKDLEHAAVLAAKTWRYTPAMLNGKPVEESMVRTDVTFKLRNDPEAARPFFARLFARAQKAIRSGKLDEAKEILGNRELADRDNLYEDAWFWWLKYEYLLAAGHSTPDQLITCLHRAIGYQEEDGFDSKASFLGPATFVAAAERLFVLQLQTLDLSGALRTYRALSNSASARRAHAYSEVMKQLKPLDAKIESLISGDRILEMHARVDEFGDSVHQLVRRSFSIGTIKGHLAGLEIRCQRGTETFAVIDSGNTYRTPESWGDCGVYVKGDKGATFALYQYPKKGK